MNLLMLTLMYPRDQLDEVTANVKDKLQNQINNYQWAFVEGIRANLGETEKLDIVNCLPVGVYPLQYRQLLLKTGMHDNHTIHQLGCINLPFFKQVFRAVNTAKAIEQWAAQSKENRTLLVYTQYLPYLQAINKVKKKYPDLKTAVIVTDLPNEMGLSTGRKGFLKKMETLLGNQSLELLRKMDGFILLTPPMKEALKIEDKSVEIIEGLILSNVELPSAPEPAKKYFLYSGTLEKELGVFEMLNAFAKMPEYDLWICGHGSLTDQVKEYENQYSNIRFWGFVPQKEALAMQAGATGLLNPRQPDGLFTRYSFPSKTLEYMRSGKPVLCCKLEGIPKDYDPYLNYMNEGAEGIIAAVRNLMLLSDAERKNMGEISRAYVVEHKNPSVQCRKLLDLLRNM
ncbi:MAG: glycosyltransferase [Clostridia bacterium]|nr:glycosyltransferase [Clostridia bacterium]